MDIKNIYMKQYTLLYTPGRLDDNSYKKKRQDGTS